MGKWIIGKFPETNTNVRKHLKKMFKIFDYKKIESKHTLRFHFIMVRTLSTRKQTRNVGEYVGKEEPYILKTGCNKS